MEVIIFIFIGLFLGWLFVGYPFPLPKKKHTIISKREYRKLLKRWDGSSL